MRALFCVFGLLVLVGCGSPAKAKPPANRDPRPLGDPLVVNAPTSDSAASSPRLEAILGRWVLDTANTSSAFGKIGVLTFGRDGRVRARAGDARDSGSWRFETDGRLRISGLGQQTLMFQLLQVDANHLELIDAAKGVVHLTASRELAASAPLTLIPEEEQPRH